MQDKSRRKMFGVRLQPEEINKIKLIARALGVSDTDAVSSIIRWYTPSPALEKAMKSLVESDKALQDLRQTA